MGYKKRNITDQDIEAMKILVERKKLVCPPWCEGIQNYYLDTYPKDLKDIKAELEK